jgi:hypothetical protein
MAWVIQRRSGGYTDPKREYVKKFDYSGYGRKPRLDWVEDPADAHHWGERSGAYKLIKRHGLDQLDYLTRVEVIEHIIVPPPPAPPPAPAPTSTPAKRRRPRGRAVTLKLRGKKRVIHLPPAKKPKRKKKIKAAPRRRGRTKRSHRR